MAMIPFKEVKNALFDYLESMFDDKGDLKNFSFVVYEWHADGSKTPLTE